MKVIFMGTPDFAVGTLQALKEAGHEITLVVTQPDKPKGRGKNVAFSPVKEAALAMDIPVFQPKKIREPENIEELKKYPADVIVVVAFGQILPPAILEMPKYGCINVHASLLPKYRGAAPIQWAVIDGEEYSGVTTMQMNEGLDTGDILLVEKVKLADDETGGSLFDKLAQTGAMACVKTLAAAEAGELHPVPQSEEGSTYAGMIRKSLGEIHFEESALRIERLIRGLNPWPSAFTTFGGKTLKIWRAQVDEAKTDAAPGTVIAVTKDSIKVACGTGALILKEIQLEGKKRMDVAAFLLGYKVTVGDMLGEVK